MPLPDALAMGGNAMRNQTVRTTLDGVVAGLIGAAVVALWFLLLDSVRGQVFETPAMLAANLLPGVHHNGTANGWLITWYSAFHFGTFAIIGAVGGLMLEESVRDPHLFIPLFIFVIAFEVFFIAVVMLLGPSAMVALPWWEVIIANLLATAAMLAYFLWRQPALAHNLLGPWIPVLREGIAAGLLGGVILAVWFLIYDAAALEMFRTPSLLGSVVFRGQIGAGISMPLIIGYTVLHFCGFIAFGIAASIMVYCAEKEPLMALGVVVLFAWFEVSYFGFVTFLDQSALEELGWWKIIVGNLLALAGMIAYFEQVHPGIVPGVFRRWNEVDSESGATLPPRLRRHPL
jgi:hypothetical protein